MNRGSPLHALRRLILRRRRRVERLTSQFTRAVGRALLQAERYGNYANGPERALLGGLQQLEHQADVLRRRLAGEPRGAASYQSALRDAVRLYGRVVDRSRSLGADGLLFRELARADRPLRKLERTFCAPSPAASRERSDNGRNRWSMPAAAPTAVHGETPSGPS